MQEFRSVKGELRLLERKGEFIFPVELWMLNDKVNENKWRFINLEEHRALWAGVPVLVAYVNGGRTVGSGHNMSERVDPKTGEKFKSFTDATAERIVGAISENEADIRLVERDGYTWVVAKGFLWAWYARELVDKITEKAAQGRAMSVSVEVFVTEEHMEGDVAVEEKYKPLGVTVLGDRVDPAIVGAHIAMLNGMESEFSALKLRAASYLGEREPGAKEKPQKNPEQKGRKSLSYLSKGQLRELQAKFGDSWRVMAAKETDNGVVVCLMDGNGKTAIYQMASVSDGVSAERIKSVNAQVHFCADGESDAVCLDACDMLEAMGERVRKAEDRCKCAEKESADLKAAMEKMESAEKQRRLAAAKKVADDTLAAFNRNRADKVEESRLASLKADIEAGKFTACTDENSLWVGDKAVEKEVLSLCAAAVMEADRKAAESGRTVYIMDKLGAGSSLDDGTVNGLLARIGIQQ